MITMLDPVTVGHILMDIRVQVDHYLRPETIFNTLHGVGPQVVILIGASDDVASDTRSFSGSSSSCQGR